MVFPHDKGKVVHVRTSSICVALGSILGVEDCTIVHIFSQGWPSHLSSRHIYSQLRQNNPIRILEKKYSSLSPLKTIRIRVGSGSDL